MKYARERVESIKAYRNVTLDDLREDYMESPWAWPTAMSFQDLALIPRDSIRDALGRKGDIYLCRYEGETYFFNVGKEEPDASKVEKMLTDGYWAVYTYSD